MATAILSSKFQLVIPKEVRDEAGITAGSRFEILSYGGRIELIPIEPLERLRGFLEGIDTAVDREDDRS